jgi:uncharacterized protein
MSTPLCHFEFISDNPDKCMAFYGKVLGWKFNVDSMPGYTMIDTGSPPAGGLMKRPPQVPKVCLNTYFMVEDIDATLKKVKEAGGNVLMPKTPIPNVGSFAFFTDPEGICVGIFQR